MAKKRLYLRKDANETAYAIVQAMIGEAPCPQVREEPAGWGTVLFGEATYRDTL